MPLVDCSQCHHTVSSVASVCPKCGHPLGERCWEQNQRTDLIRCVKCKELVAPGASVCRNCGVLEPTDHRIRRSPVKLVVLSLLAVGLIAGARSFSQTEGAFNPLASRGAPNVATDTANETLTAASVAEALVTDSARPLPPPSIRTVPSPRVVQASAIDSSDSLVKWTNTWVNVRAGRSIDTPVVLTLNPAEKLDVGDLRRGWWAAYVDGRLVGYVANSVLADQPSDSLLTTQ